VAFDLCRREAGPLSQAVNTRADRRDTERLIDGSHPENNALCDESPNCKVPPEVSRASGNSAPVHRHFQVIALELEGIRERV